MRDERKTKKQLISELADIRRRVAELEALDTDGELAVQKAQLFLEFCADATVIVNRDGEISFINERTSDLFGYPQQELAGKPVEFLVPKRSRSQHTEHRQKYLANPTVRPMGMGLDLYGLRNDGSKFPVDISLSPFDIDGETMVLASIRDITERKQAEDALRESEQRFRSIFQHAAFGIAVEHTDGSFIEVNDAWCKMLGYSKEELLATNFRAITYPDDLEASRHAVEKLLAGEITSIQMEKRYLHKGGETPWGHASVSLVPDNRGKPLFFIAAIQDITKRKRAEEELKKREEKLAQQNVLLNEKNIALREVIGQVKEEKERIEEQIQANVERLVHPVFSKLRSNTLRFDEKVIDLLEDNLNHLTASFGSKVSSKMFSLSQREIEICNMVKSGLSSKEIAGLLTISYRTVETHRNRIRKKLGLINKEINLSSYLKTL